MDKFDATKNIPVADSNVEVPEGHNEIVDFINNSYSLKPVGLIMSELKWKYLVRSAVRGKNIMMTGQAGCGKTLAAKSIINALDRPEFYFNLGATQDPRSTLIGNVHYNKEKGQRYLRLDEADGQATVSVADGVTFVATANIGNEYTATRQLDKALHDRFTVIEMDLLDEAEEFGLLNYMFPTVDGDSLNNVAKITSLTRVEAVSENARIASGVSTRTSVEIAGLLFDGFSLLEAADITIYPQYDAAGGVDSERTFVKQIVQKFISDGTDEELFTDHDIDESGDSMNN
jgi:hypothetical protein